MKNNMVNLANFPQDTLRSQNWYFHGIFSYIVQNAWAKN